MGESKIILDKFSSNVLEGNPLGDPATRKLPVYLPPDYDGSDKRYPAAYLLVGFAGRGRKLLNDSFWNENIQERMDRLIAGGIVQPMILVMPDATTRYGGAQYLNSSALGNYEDYILEIVEHVDGEYRTLADREHRAIGGHSSGGFGALRFGMRHPEAFGMVFDHSGDKYFEMVYKHDFPHFLRFYDKHGEQGLKDLLADPVGMVNQGTSFYALNTAAMAACYSPNPDSPYGFDLPFDPQTGELRQEVWARWLAHDPINQVEEYSEALRSLELLYFECGLYDEYNLLYGARIFKERLEKLAIPFQYQEFEGGHRNMEDRYDESLTAVSEAMSKA
jgi:enterochelin esterase family protein